MGTKQRWQSRGRLRASQPWEGTILELRFLTSRASSAGFGGCGEHGGGVFPAQRHNKLLIPRATASSARNNLPFCLSSTSLSPGVQRTQLDFPKAGPCWARAALAHRKAGRDLKDHPDPTLRTSGIQYCPPHLCDPSSCAPDVCWGLISAGTRAEGSCKGGINQQEEQTIPRFKLSKPRILGRLGRILPRKVTFGAVG